MDIISLSSFDKSVRDFFKSGKLSLREAGYPPAESKTFTMPYIGLVKHKLLKSIPPGSLLVSVPSTNSSNPNPIPYIFAKETSRFIDGCEAINGSFICHPLHTEKKANTSFYKTQTPHYSTLEKISSLKEYSQNRPVYVMEDWASTGESALNFAKTLSNNGVSVSGIATLIINDKYFPSLKDLTKNSDILQRQTGISTKEADMLISANFAPYLRHKLSRFVLSDIHSDKELLLSSLRDKTAFYVQNKYVDPSIGSQLSSYRQQNRDLDISL